MRIDGTHGFSLVEALISLVILLFLMSGALMSLQHFTRVARVQTHVSDLQQGVRASQREIVHIVRMAGRGANVHGGSLLVRDGSERSDDFLIPGDTSSPRLRGGSDVVVARGVFTTPLYFVNPGSGSLELSGDTGILRIAGQTVAGLTQDLGPLRDLIAAGNSDALLLTAAGTSGLFAVVEIEPSRSSVDPGPSGAPSSVEIGFRVAGGSGHANAYAALSSGGSFPEDLNTVARAGILEEYHYYVRDVSVADAAQKESELSRARLAPGTGAPHLGDATRLVDTMAGGILDLQAALGIDLDGDGRILEDIDGDASVDDSDRRSNEWRWDGDGEPTTWPAPASALRLTLLGRSSRPDVGYVSPPIERIENHVYDEAFAPVDGDDRIQRAFRRRRLVTLVELRNAGS